MNPYAANKGIMHVDRLRAIRNGVACAPVHAHFVVSDICNHRCTFCAYRMPDYPCNEMFDDKRIMPPGLAKEIICDAHRLGIRALQFTGGGEPTVHPSLPGFICEADDLGIETAVVTNGSNLSANLVDAMMNCTWIRVSLDAATPETYAAIRQVKPDAFERTLNGIRRLVAARQENNLGQYIGIGFVVTPDNYLEIPAFVALADDLRVDNVRLSAAFQSQDLAYYDGGVFEHAASLCADAMRSDRLSGLTVSNNFFERAADLELGPPDYKRCAYQHLTTYIGADANVYRCCVTSYNKHGLLGSIRDYGGLDKLWRAEETQRRLREFDARSCVRCQFNDKNRVLNSMIDGLPTGHWNFV